MKSGAQTLIARTRHDTLSTAIFRGLNCAYNRRYKIDKVNMHLSNLNSIESFARFLDIKFLPELSLSLYMLE